MRLLLLVLATVPAAGAATNSFRWSTNYYTVTGTDLRALHASLEQARPWKDKATFAGMTDWRLDWRYQVEPSEGACRCVSFTTTLTITTTLPRWAPGDAAAAPPEVKEAWDRFIKALGEHEYGHARLALAALADVHHKVKGLGSDPDCRALGRRIDATAQKALDEHRQRDRDFDLKTRHGANQGAVIPRGPPPR
jgi:predicted secreted Zn-dependent protease